MSEVIQISAMPSVMEAKLRAIRRRQVILVVTRALMIGASVLLAAMLVAMFIDWSFTLFHTGVRAALTAAALALAGIALLAAAARPLTESLGWTPAAAKADEAAPQLEERWTTVTSFATGNQRLTPAAQAMLQQVTREAAAMGRLVEPRRAVRPTAVRPALWMLLGCWIALAGVLALGGRQSSVLLRRFWSPWANITATQLRSLTGDVTIPRGETLELTTEWHGVARGAASLAIEHDSGVVDVFALQPDKMRPGTFAHSLRVENSFRYQVRAGDGQTAWHRVSAIDYPELADVRFTITAPAYVNRPPVEKALIPRRVSVVEGSRLVLLMKPRTEVERLQVTLNYAPQAEEGEAFQERMLALPPDAEGWYRFEMQLFEDVSLHPLLANAHGLTSRDKQICFIQVIADQAPVARIVSPSPEAAVALDEQIEIKFEAHDDHGIATAELVVYDESAAEHGEQPTIVSVQEIPLGDQRLAKHVTASTRLELNALNLEPGASISYAIRVTDNRQTVIDPNDMTEFRSEARPGRRSADPTNQAGSPLDRLPAGKEVARADGYLPVSVRPVDPLEEATDAQAGNEVTDASPRNDNRNARPSGDPAPLVAAAGETQLANSEEGAHEATAAPHGAADGSSDAASSASQQHAPQADRDRAEPNGDEALATARANGESNLANEPLHPPMPNEADIAAAGRQDEKDETTAQPEGTASVADSGTGSGSEPRQSASSNPQQAASGQNAETSRRRLRITARLTSVAEAGDRQKATRDIRDRVVHVDKMLAAVEAGLQSVMNREVPDAERSSQFRTLDEQLGDVEQLIAELHNDTKENELAFAGLQMVDIGHSHVTPARDRVFVAIRDPAGAETYAGTALQHVVRARELLAALLERYDRVARERELAQAIEQTVTVYEVYVEKMQRLMREAQQSANPLERKMAVIEVDQEYLDRYAEVLTLRREMLAEFARMLADDPRLMGRYLDLIKRRRASLRDQLSELAERQDEIATELSGWLQVDAAQRADLWTVLVEMRLHATTDLAKDAAELAERIEKQAPLVLEPAQGTAAAVIHYAQEIGRLGRSISFDARKLLEARNEQSQLTPVAEQLVAEFGRLDAALDLLRFQNEDQEEVTAYVAARLLESRTVADRAIAWAAVARHLEVRRYAGLAEVDQRKVSIATELLRLEMLGIQGDLDAQFQQQTQSGVPAQILDLIQRLHHVMEAVVFNQAAATFAMTRGKLDEAQLQQSKAVEGFARAEELFDRIRREVVDALDEYDAQNPNIADLVDPTLDEFLARLEREPNIEAQLGLPNRPRNLRVVAESLLWQQVGGDGLGSSAEAARQRALQAMKPQPRPSPGEHEPEHELTDQHREQMEKERETQDMLAKSLAAIEEKMKDRTLSPQERRKLEQMAESMRRLQDQMQEGPHERAWDELAESDQAREMLRALARGEAIPDQQWNKLLSTLEDGLWQVRGKTPPADYRKAIEQYQDRIRQLMDLGN